MMEYNKVRVNGALESWVSIIKDIAAHDGNQLRQIPENYNDALQSVYGIESLQV
jgi:hypothetical protein